MTAAPSATTSDHRSFEDLCREVGTDLRREAIRRVGLDDADDLVQDTLSRAWQHRASFDPSRGSARTWVRAIARNAVVDRRRRSATRAATIDELCTEHALAPEAPVEGEVVASIEAADLRRAIATLRADQRAILWHVYWRQRSHTEVAGESSLPFGTVKSRVRLALASLRLELEGLAAR